MINIGDGTCFASVVRIGALSMSAVRHMLCVCCDNPSICGAICLRKAHRKISIQFNALSSGLIIMIS